MAQSRTSLPPLLQEIADAAGLDAAVRLAEEKGGLRVFIPKQVERDHWLAKLVGLDAAKKISHYFCHETGQHLDLPIFARNHERERALLFQRLQNEGKSANEISAAMKITRRAVFLRRASNQTDSDPDQSSLFDK